MNPTDAKAKVTARVWQSIAQSGVSVSAIPNDQLNALVDAIADGVLLAIDDTLSEAGLPDRQVAASTLPLHDEERVLWEGRPFLSLNTLYQITSERVRVIRGLLAKDRDDIELIRIQDIDHDQSLSERALNIGDITLRSSDPTLPETVLRNVTNVQEVHEILRRAMLEARKKFRYSVQEEM
jgi:hypothetical protein